MRLSHTIPLVPLLFTQFPFVPLLFVGFSKLASPSSNIGLFMQLLSNRGGCPYRNPKFTFQKALSASIRFSQCLCKNCASQIRRSSEAATQVGMAAVLSERVLDQNGPNDHFGQNDLIPNWILAFRTKMDQNGPFWSILA